MKEQIIPGAEQVTPEWLTGVLYENGALAQGQVLEVIPDEQQSTFASLTSHLEVRYSEDGSSDAPRKLFLKCSHSDLVPGEGGVEKLQKEIDFYRLVVPAMADTPSVPCYAAAFDPQSNASHLLLRDVSETHEACLDPLHRQNPYRAVEALARLHAFWWDHPRLGDGIGRLPTRESYENSWADTAQRTDAFIQTLGDRLPTPWRKTYEHVTEALPKLYRRHLSGHNLTLVHGDAHLGNFLFPRESSATNRAYIIDWQFWHPTIGGTDLAFMIATEWESETRRALERPLLRHYYATLLQQGVDDYGWDDCWNDYRLCVIVMSLFIPVWRWSIFKWEADLDTVATSMAAFDELRCAELL